MKEIVILIDKSLEKKVANELYEHICSLCNLLQGEEEKYLEIIKR